MTRDRMKRFVALSLAFVLAFSGLLSTACNSGGSGNAAVSPSPVTSQPSGRYFTFQTDNSKVPAMAIDAEEGVLLGVVTGDRPDSSGAVFVHNGKPIVVFRNAIGLPGRMVVGNTVFLFENYTDTTVDIASVSGNQFEIARRVPVDAAKLASLRASMSLPSDLLRRPAALSREWKQVLDATALLVNIAACAVAIAFPPAGALAGLILACSSAVIGVLTLPGILDANTKDALELVEGVKTITDYVGCVWGSPVAALIQCFAAAIDTFKLAAPGIFDLTDSLAEALEELLKPDPPEPNPATNRSFQGSFVASGTYTIGDCVWKVVDNFSDVRVVLPPVGNGAVWAAQRTTIGPLIKGTDCVPFSVDQELTMYRFLKVTVGAQTWRFEAISSPDAPLVFDGTASAASASGSYSRQTKQINVSGDFSLGAGRW